MSWPFIIPFSIRNKTAPAISWGSIALDGNDDDLSNSAKKYGKTGPVILELMIDGDILLTRMPF